MDDYLSLVARELERCNKCGFCTAVCPTFQATGMETQVTRGRVSLLQDVRAGTLTLAEAAISFDTCLLCEACLSVCPPKVDIGALVSAARGQLRAEQGIHPVERFVLRTVLPWPRLLRLATEAGALADRLGLRAVAGRLGLLKGTLGRAARVGPRLALKGARSAIGTFHQPSATKPRARVAYYITCIKDAVYPDVARAAVAVLRANDVEVVLPQVSCCGLPHHSAGDLQGMKQQARRNLAALADLDVDAIILDDGSCTAHLLHLPEILAGDPEEETARRVAAKIRDLAVFLEELGPAPMGALNARVTWHDSCSHKHGIQSARAGQHPTEAARRLIRRIPGITFVEAPPSTECCGGAGAIMIKQPETSDLVLEQKFAALDSTQPDYIVASAPSCVMQLQRGARERGSAARVVFLAELLALTYGPCCAPANPHGAGRCGLRCGPIEPINRGGRRGMIWHKRFLSSTVAVLLTAVLAACSGSASKQATPAAPAQSGGQQQAKPASGEPIPIGVSAPLTAQFAMNGTYMKNGINLAVDEINAKGGIKGRPVKVFYEDDQGPNPTAAGNAITKLITQYKVVAMIGPHFTPAMLPSEPIFEKNQIPALTGASGAVITEQKNPWIFRIRLNDKVGGQLLTQYTLDKLGYKKIGLGYVNTSFGQSGIQVVQDYLTKLGIKPVEIQTHLDDTKDFTSQLLAWEKAGVDGVIIWTDDQPSGLLAKQKAQLGLKYKIAGSTTFSQPPFLKLAGEAANGIYSISDFTPDNPDSRIQQWKEKYRKVYGQDPELYASAYYDAMNILAEAIKKAEKIDGPSIQKALTTVKDLPGVVTDYTWSENGDMVHSGLITVVKDGKVTVDTRVTEKK